jgi:RimJ/RimL family protein N-acetyltransferase
MNFYINDDFSLTAVAESDADTLTECLISGTVQKTTCQIPFPYTQQDARNFIEAAGERSQKFGRMMDWAIRQSDGRLIGMIGFKGSSNFSKGIDEIGFWLAETCWGKGIMTEALSGFVRLSFDVFWLQRLEAVIFECNEASIKVVKKCGFYQTEFLSDYVYKGDSSIKALKFVRVKNQ